MVVAFSVCVNVLIYGIFGWAVMGWMGHRSHARVAGLFLALGFVIGNFGGHSVTDTEDVLQLRAFGSIVVLGALTAFMFYRHRRTAR